MRLQAVQRYVLPDIELDKLFKRVVALAARLLNTPAAAVSLVDAEQVLFKAKHGMEIDRIARQPGLCSSAILSDHPLIVADALHDPQLAMHPLVSGPFGLRFYAGVPLSTPEGLRIGMLCVMGYQPRIISDEELATLRELGRALMDGMACREPSSRSFCIKESLGMTQNHKHARRKPRQERLAKEHGNASEMQYRSLLDLSSDLYWEQDEKCRFRSISPAPEGKCRFRYECALGKTLAEIPNISMSREDWETHAKAVESRQAFHELTIKWTGEENQIHYASISGRPVLSASGKLIGYCGIARDVTEKMIAQEELARSHAAWKQLSTALQTFGEIERKRIAHELHDDLAQLLATSRMDLALLKQEVAQSLSFQQRVAALDQLLGTSIVALRRIATELRPSALDEGSLYFALKCYLKQFSKKEGVTCELIADESELVLDELCSTAIFRMIQEALFNIGRFTQVKKIKVLLCRDGKNLSILIEYEECSMGRQTLNENEEEERSLYLLAMRERVYGLNGVMDMFGKPEKGMTLLITIPMKTGAHA